MTPSFEQALALKAEAIAPPKAGASPHYRAVEIATEATAGFFAVPVSMIRGGTSWDAVRWRRMAIWAADQTTGAGQHVIGDFFNRTHDAVRESVKLIEEKRGQNATFRQVTDMLRNAVRASVNGRLG